MVIKEIYTELTEKLSPVIINKNIERDGDTPFGYILCCIRDMYGITKKEAWDTADAICAYFDM